MTFAGLLILASGLFLLILAGSPVAVRQIRGLFFGSYAGVIMAVGVSVNLASGFAQTTHSLTIPSMRDDLGISYTQVGLLITVAGAVRMGASITAGTLAPRLDLGVRKSLLCSHPAGTFISGGSMFLLGYSPNYFTALGATALMGLGSNIAVTPMMGLLAPWFEIRNRGLAAGVLATGGSIATPRYGSRYFVAAGTFISGGSMFLLGYSPNYFTALGATALMGLGSNIAVTPMMGLLAPWFEIRNRGLAAGVLATGGSIAMISTGLLVPLLIGQNPTEGWRNTWFIFGGLVIIIGVAAQIFLRDRPQPLSGGSTKAVASDEPRPAWPLTVFKNPWVWLLSYLALCSGFATGVFTTFFGAYLTDENGFSLSTVGQLFLLIGVLSVASGILWGRISDRLGRGRAFALSFTIQGVGYALFWLSPIMAVLVLVSVLLGLTFRAGFTLCAAGSGDHVPAIFASTAFAMMAVGANLGETLSPVIAGTIADTVGLSWVFALGVGASLLGVVGGLMLRSPSTSVKPAIAGPGD